jgi:hypothetical protein
LLTAGTGSINAGVVQFNVQNIDLRNQQLNALEKSDEYTNELLTTVRPIHRSAQRTNSLLSAGSTELATAATTQCGGCTLPGIGRRLEITNIPDLHNSETIKQRGGLFTESCPFFVSILLLLFLSFQKS